MFSGDSNNIKTASYKLQKMALKNTPSKDKKEYIPKNEREIEQQEEQIPIIINILDEIDSLIYGINQSQDFRNEQIQFSGGMIADEDDEDDEEETPKKTRRKQKKMIERDEMAREDFDAPSEALRKIKIPRSPAVRRALAIAQGLFPFGRRDELSDESSVESVDGEYVPSESDYNPSESDYNPSVSEDEDEDEDDYQPNLNFDEFIRRYGEIDDERVPIEERIGPIPDASFIASESFIGPLEGYVFRLGDEGSGYYPDVPGDPITGDPIPGDPIPGYPISGVFIETLSDNSPNVLKLQEKVNRLSILTKSINKYINLSSNIVIETLRKINNSVKNHAQQLLYSITREYIIPQRPKSEPKPLFRILKLLQTTQEIITSAINSYSGNFIGMPQVGGNYEGTDENTMFEIYKTSPKKRFF